MDKLQELLPGAWLLGLKRFDDARGSFVKTYAQSALDALGLGLMMKEEFYSVSARHVLRGMHLQLPPMDHVKLVYCAAGAVQDVLLDLRRGPGYGRYAQARLDSRQPQLLLIPRGVAHGFLSLEDGSLMVYKTSTEHAPHCDVGVRWDSFGFDWGLEAAPIVSARDQAHPPLNEFESPF